MPAHKQKIVNPHRHFCVKNERLVLIPEQYIGCETEVLVSFGLCGLPFAPEYDASFTIEAFERLARYKKRKIRQLFLFWVEKFDFEDLSALVSLEVCESNAVHFDELLVCENLRYFAATELFSLECADLQVLSALKMYGVAVDLLNVKLPDLRPQQFEFYSIGDIPAGDRHNQFPLATVSDALARQTLSETLYRHFCRFKAANSSRVFEKDEAARQAAVLQTRYECLLQLLRLRWLARRYQECLRKQNRLIGEITARTL